jgi:hypothetical protein
MLRIETAVAGRMLRIETAVAGRMLRIERACRRARIGMRHRSAPA